MEGSIVSLCRLDRIGVTTTSQTLVELLAAVGSSIHPQVKNMILYNYGAAIVHMNDHGADATTSCFELAAAANSLVSGEPVELRVSASEAAGITLISAAGTINVGVSQRGDNV